jgi:hypothetical protein
MNVPGPRERDFAALSVIIDRQKRERVLMVLEAALADIDTAEGGLRQSHLFSNELQRLLGYPFGPKALDKSSRAWEASKSAYVALKVIIEELKSDG